jgi:hypothetical protein
MRPSRTCAGLAFARERCASQNLQPIARANAEPSRDARAHFEDAPRAQPPQYTPGAQRPRRGKHESGGVAEHDIDRTAHPEPMHGIARPQAERPIMRERGATDEASRTRAEGLRKLDLDSGRAPIAHQMSAAHVRTPP